MKGIAASTLVHKQKWVCCRWQGYEGEAAAGGDVYRLEADDYSSLTRISISFVSQNLVPLM